MSDRACPEWEEAIAAYLDGELSPIEEQRVHAHMHTCVACAEALVDLVPLVQALRTAPAEAPTRDLWPRVAAELRHEPMFSRRLRQIPPRLLAWSAAAAVVLLVGLASLGPLLAGPERVADVDTYWHEHALYSQDQGVPGTYAPALHAVKSSYDLDP